MKQPSKSHGSLESDDPRQRGVTREDAAMIRWRAQLGAAFSDCSGNGNGSETGQSIVSCFSVRDAAAQRLKSLNPFLPRRRLLRLAAAHVAGLADDGAHVGERGEFAAGADLREQVAHGGGFHRASDDGPLAGVRRAPDSPRRCGYWGSRRYVAPARVGNSMNRDEPAAEAIFLPLRSVTATERPGRG